MYLALVTNLEAKYPKLPSALPHHMHLDVDFSHNRIDLGDRRFKYSSVDYFSRIKKLKKEITKRAM
jgi:hypothetical protein